MRNKQAAGVTHHCCINDDYTLYHHVGKKMVKNLKKQSCKSIRLSAILISAFQARDSGREPAMRNKKISV